jgi:uncharacterized membrane protein
LFQALFSYPFAAYAHGEFLLLGAWPRWLLGLLVLAGATALAILILLRWSRATVRLQPWRLAVLWLLESALAGLLLLLLWQPSLAVTELRPRQNIVAVLIDDSRSMALSENGATREAQAVTALENGTLAQLRQRFQTRLYRMDSELTLLPDLTRLQPQAPATRIGDSLKQLVAETDGLPVGAVVLLSDGGDNSGGIDRDAIAALRSRRIPVHTVGFGAEQISPDIELDDVTVTPHALAGSRITATAIFHQRGYVGQKTQLTVRAGDEVVATRTVTFGAESRGQSETLLFNAGAAGARALRFTLQPLPGELNSANNELSRLITLESEPRRILYIEGEPRWEYKFIRRAEEQDPAVQLVSMLRTTENKIYRQGIADPKELADGFPTRAQELFKYQAIVIGSVDAGYFTPTQQQLLRDFVDRRGGGLLLLGGRASLADGVWGSSLLADLLPVTLPGSSTTFHRQHATVALTAAGADSPICRLTDDAAANVQHWKALPYLMDYQDPGTAKPGAQVLAQMTAGARTMPLLVTENYGRGRTAVLATGGTWRWQMSLPLGDASHAMFWQQLLRWLATDTRGTVIAAVTQPTLLDYGHVELSAQVRDQDYALAGNAQVEAHILGPSGVSARVPLSPDPDSPGMFRGEWSALQPGAYLTEVSAKRGDEELGRDVLSFQRLDGVAENFHTAQNRELLQRLASETGGRYWQAQDLSGLAAAVPYSEAGISARDLKPLWHLPAVFLLLISLRCADWLLRRQWGVV